MPEGLPEGCQSEPTKHEGNGDCSYYNTTHVNCLKQQNPQSGLCEPTKPVAKESLATRPLSSSHKQKHMFQKCKQKPLANVLLFVGGA